MLRRILLLVGLLLPVLATGTIAQGIKTPPAQISEETEAAATALLAALGMGELVGIMRREGIDYGADLEAEMFPGRGGTGWPALVEQIYETNRMAAIMQRELAARMTNEQIADSLRFFESDLGRRIVQLEISARRALLEPSVEEASNEMLFDLRENEAARLDVLDRFITANDLVELNVVGALNANLAFYQGLIDGGGFDFDIPEEDMLRDVWAQEPQIREDTDLWVWSYLAMAYRPLGDDEVTQYAEMSETDSGKALNTALFAAFDVLFVTISRDLGLAAARFMAGEDI